ncbi:MAG: hypothetical protein WCR31_10375 [Treponema sp.]
MTVCTIVGEQEGPNQVIQLEEEKEELKELMKAEFHQNIKEPPLRRSSKTSV